MDNLTSPQSTLPEMGNGTAGDNPIDRILDAASQTTDNRTPMQVWKDQQKAKAKAAGRLCLVCGTDDPRRWVKADICWPCKRMGLKPGDSVPVCLLNLTRLHLMPIHGSPSSSSMSTTTTTPPTAPSATKCSATQ